MTITAKEFLADRGIENETADFVLASCKIDQNAQVTPELQAQILKTQQELAAGQPQKAKRRRTFGKKPAASASTASDGPAIEVRGVSSLTINLTQPVSDAPVSVTRPQPQTMPAATSKHADDKVVEPVAEVAPTSAAPLPSSSSLREKEVAADTTSRNPTSDFTKPAKRQAPARGKGPSPTRRPTRAITRAQPSRDIGQNRRGGRNRPGLTSEREYRHARKGKHINRDPVPVGEVEVPEAISVALLAQRMNMKATSVIRALFQLGEVVTPSEVIDQDTASLVVAELGGTPIIIKSRSIDERVSDLVQQSGDSTTRPPVIAVMGHVDHGKTSLLDYIRKARVASKEAGGITQRIGAYLYKGKNGDFCFIDTPGHAAFSQMRAHGAKATDVAVLVVAADDGVKPQTEEAATHAKEAGVPIVVALTKCDLQDINLEPIKAGLAGIGLQSEDWGGNVQCVPVSSVTGEGIDALLAAVSLEAELLDLKAQTKGAAQGTVLESRTEKGLGNVVSILVMKGTLRVGDAVLAGEAHGKIKRMMDDTGKILKTAGPVTPIEVMGISNNCEPGMPFAAVPDINKAREFADEFSAELTAKRMASSRSRVSSESLFDGLNKEHRVVSLIIRGDRQGVVDAITTSVSALGTDDVDVKIVSSGTGAITQSDVTMAKMTNSRIIGFDVRADTQARKMAQTEEVPLDYYSIIYELQDDVATRVEGLKEVEIKERIIGLADVREVFNSPQLGSIAGCLVIDGVVRKDKRIRVLRQSRVVFEGTLESLRRFKDSVEEVRMGTECGIGVAKYDVAAGDQIEVYDRIDA